MTACQHPVPCDRTDTSETPGGRYLCTLHRRQAACEALDPPSALPVLPPEFSTRAPCCKRDTDGDGQCPAHPAGLPRCGVCGEGAHSLIRVVGRGVEALRACPACAVDLRRTQGLTLDIPIPEDVRAPGRESPPGGLQKALGTDGTQNAFPPEEKPNPVESPHPTTLADYDQIIAQGGLRAQVFEAVFGPPTVYPLGGRGQTLVAKDSNGAAWISEDQGRTWIPDRSSAAYALEEIERKARTLHTPAAFDPEILPQPLGAVEFRWTLCGAGTEVGYDVTLGADPQGAAQVVDWLRGRKVWFTVCNPQGGQYDLGVARTALSTDARAWALAWARARALAMIRPHARVWWREPCRRRTPTTLASRSCRQCRETFTCSGADPARVVCESCHQHMQGQALALHEKFGVGVDTLYDRAIRTLTERMDRNVVDLAPNPVLPPKRHI